ncbi:MAG: hypothetical protein RMY28_023685 [Nostoc sp. ChiSLP01]|nr:hypothetical protein [Nostoc sp. CmiSLP01]MDZ8289415.1 hypothetical protein [Nostoc sp. ChiSLP01]
MIPNYDYAALYFAITMGGLRSPADTMKVRCPLRQRTFIRDWHRAMDFPNL